MTSTGVEIALGDREIIVTADDGTRHIAPSLICHYVLEHRYQPPAEFMAAVLG
ncbi:MAG TPA: hypothetical protein VF375_02420 [Candidatus Limnocylindrales bacterium]